MTDKEQNDREPASTQYGMLDTIFPTFRTFFDLVLGEGTFRHRERAKERDRERERQREREKQIFGPLFHFN